MAKNKYDFWGFSLRLVFVFLSVSCASSCTSDKSFPLPDPTAITSVELFTQTDTTRLNRANDGTWLLGSEQTPTNLLKTKNLLEILTRIEVEYPLPLEDQKQFTSDVFQSEGLHVKAYNGTKLLKSYALLFPDKYNCVGLMSGKRQAYCLYFPGANIQLADYLSAAPQFWHNNEVFNYSPSQILQIEVKNNEQASESFRLVRGESGSMQLFSIMPEKLVPADAIAVKRYLTYFQGVAFEDYAPLPKEELNAIAKAVPLYTLTLTSAEGARTYRAVAKPLAGQTNNYDRDYFYFVLDDGKQVVLAKWIEFDILFKRLTEFANKEHK